MKDFLFYTLLLLVSGGFFTYIYFCLRFYFGFKNYKPKLNYKTRRVSVIVVSRNEAENLRRLMLALTNQTYDKNFYEIIIADDDSEDDTESVIRQYENREIPVHYLRVLGRENSTSPKKQALEKAINLSQGELILTTDADCLVPPTWVEKMVAAFTDDVSMVAGYSRTLLPDWNKASILHKYEHFDFASTYMVLGGGYTIGRSWACIGQNLAYTRKAFDSVDGFNRISHLISGDDVNLMQLMRRNRHKIIFNFDPKSFVHTLPVKSWKHFVNQRSRWASNMKYQLKFDPEFFFILLSMGMMYWGAYLMLFLCWQVGLGIFLFRITIENIFFSYARSRFGVTGKMAAFYPVWLVIQSFMLVFTMILGQFNLFVWHGKRPYRGVCQNDAGDL